MIQITSLGYRVLVQEITLAITRDSDSILIPEELRQKIKCFVVIQVGVGKGHGIHKKNKRPPMEVKKGDRVLVDTSKGSQGIKELSIGKYEFLLVSYHDVIAILEDGSEPS